MSMLVSAPYLPFMDASQDAGFRWRLGVRPLDLADWIEWGPDAAHALAEKARLSEEHRAEVFAVLDDIDDEAREAATAIAEHVGRPLDPALHPLDAAARLVPEDLVLMVEREGSLVFGGGSVCFPNRWDLRSKVGQTLAEVHAPVAQLNEQLEDAVDRFFERLRPERSYWRLGWGVIDTADWFTPPGARSSGADGPYLRVERETIRRFPATGCVLFTIRTYVSPLASVATDPVVRRRLAAAIEALPDDVRVYKDLAATADRLVAELGDQRGAE